MKTEIHWFFTHKRLVDILQCRLILWGSYCDLSGATQRKISANELIKPEIPWEKVDRWLHSIIGENDIVQ